MSVAVAKTPVRRRPPPPLPLPPIHRARLPVWEAPSPAFAPSTVPKFELEPTTAAAASSSSSSSAAAAPPRPSERAERLRREAEENAHAQLDHFQSARSEAVARALESSAASSSSAAAGSGGVPRSLAQQAADAADSAAELRVAALIPTKDDIPARICAPELRGFAFPPKPQIPAPAAKIMLWDSDGVPCAVPVDGRALAANACTPAITRPVQISLAPGIASQLSGANLARIPKGYEQLKLLPNFVKGLTAEKIAANFTLTILVFLASTDSAREHRDTIWSNEVLECFILETFVIYEVLNGRVSRATDGSGGYLFAYNFLVDNPAIVVDAGVDYPSTGHRGNKDWIQKAQEHLDGATTTLWSTFSARFIHAILCALRESPFQDTGLIPECGELWTQLAVSKFGRQAKMRRRSELFFQRHGFMMGVFDDECRDAIRRDMGIPAEDVDIRNKRESLRKYVPALDIYQSSHPKRHRSMNERKAGRKRVDAKEAADAAVAAPSLSSVAAAAVAVAEAGDRREDADGMLVNFPMFFSHPFPMELLEVVMGNPVSVLEKISALEPLSDIVKKLTVATAAQAAKRNPSRGPYAAARKRREGLVDALLPATRRLLSFLPITFAPFYAGELTGDQSKENRKRKTTAKAFFRQHISIMLEEFDRISHPEMTAALLTPAGFRAIRVIPDPKQPLVYSVPNDMFDWRFSPSCMSAEIAKAELLSAAPNWTDFKPDLRPKARCYILDEKDAPSAPAASSSSSAAAAAAATSDLLPVTKRRAFLNSGSRPLSLYELAIIDRKELDKEVRTGTFAAFEVFAVLCPGLASAHRHAMACLGLTYRDYALKFEADCVRLKRELLARYDRGSDMSRVDTLRAQYLLRGHLPAMASPSTAITEDRARAVARTIRERIKSAVDSAFQIATDRLPDDQLEGTETAKLLQLLRGLPADCLNTHASAFVAHLHPSQL